MLQPLIMTALLLVSPAADTTWWSTDGAKVIEQSEGNNHYCLLMFHNNYGAIIFGWDRNGQKHLTAIRRDWQYPQGSDVSVAVQIGNTWLREGDGLASSSGYASQTSVTVQLGRPVEDLIADANRIVVQVPESLLTIVPNRSKMPPIMSGIRHCKEVLRHR